MHKVDISLKEANKQLEKERGEKVKKTKVLQSIPGNQKRIKKTKVILNDLHIVYSSQIF